MLFRPHWVQIKAKISTLSSKISGRHLAHVDHPSLFHDPIKFDEERYILPIKTIIYCMKKVCSLEYLLN
jgi:hypothetical protein